MEAMLAVTGVSYALMEAMLAVTGVNYSQMVAIQINNFDSQNDL